ncbi:MAG: hypothetical protein U9R02_13865 [Thermodesulfobacteriota bacterium]|nr:hypothetical protein [Thermodesulfobacteriota bacterium]
MALPFLCQRRYGKGATMNNNSEGFEKDWLAGANTQSFNEKKERPRQEEKKLTGWEAMFEKNMCAKMELARELIDMGLSKEAGERILHMDRADGS